MNASDKSKVSAYSEDYAKFFGDSSKAVSDGVTKQWSSQGDYLIKFSLLDENLRSVASAGTQNVNLF